MTPGEALKVALHEWRSTRHSRFAAICLLADQRSRSSEPPRPVVGDGGKKTDVEAWQALFLKKDPLDVTRLLAAVGGGKSAIAAERIEALAKLDDPRVVSGLLSFLEAPPYRARTAMPFFRACLAALSKANDPRVKPALEDLAPRYKAILETSVGDDVSTLIKRTAEAMTDDKPSLKPKQEQTCAQLEALFEQELSAGRRASSQQKSDVRSDEAMLAAIHDAPNDDGPRLVFADALTERGDVRGEFISLQLLRARGAATRDQRIRERALVADHKLRAAWALPLSQGGDCHLARGLPDAIVVDGKQLKTIVGDSALRLLHTVTGLERGTSTKQAVAFLTHANTQHLTRVEPLSQTLVDALPTSLPWPEVALHYLPEPADIKRFTALRALGVNNGSYAMPDTLLKPEALAHAPNLESLSIVDLVPTKEALAPLTKLRVLIVFAYKLGEALLGPRYGDLPALRELELRITPTIAQLAGLRLETLACHDNGRFDLPGLISAMPSLREVSLSLSNGNIDRVRTLLTDRRTSALRRLDLDRATVHAPYSADGVLEFHPWGPESVTELEKFLQAMPDGCVARVRITPRSPDPLVHGGFPLLPQNVDALRAAHPHFDIEQDWV